MQYVMRYWVLMDIEDYGSTQQRNTKKKFVWILMKPQNIEEEKSNLINVITQYFKLFCRPQASSAMFFKYNTQLGPPYHIIVDTNFINFSIKNKLEIIQSMMDCLYAKCKCSYSSAHC